jgi:PAS domain S-box-containing protein
MSAEHLKMLNDQHLTGQDWQIIAKLYDLLAGAANPPDGICTGIEFILASLGGTGAALFIPGSRDLLSDEWIFISVPPLCQEDLKNNRPPYASLLQRALTSGSVVAGDAALNLGGVLPLRNDEEVHGALIVFGPVIPSEAYGKWLLLLRTVSRILSVYGVRDRRLANLPSYSDLINSRNTLRALFDSLPISIYIIDINFRLVAVNNSRAARAGSTPRMLFGETCYVKLFQRTSPCQNCQAAATFATGQSTGRLHRDWLEHDAFVEWEISTFPIQSENGSPLQIIIVEADVTEKRNLEANLVQSEKLAAVGQLAAGVAHEINNPLTAIIANIQLLQREIDPREVDLLDSVKLIETASTRAQQVVRNLLGIARKEKYQFEPVDINETLQNALSLVQHELVGRPIQIQLSLADNIPSVTGSQDHLQGVWINLLLNAIDAIDKNNGHIAITSKFTGTDFQVVIQDNGKGIRPEYLGRVFEPFFTTKTVGRGTGLGLSVCMRVIRQHNGSITAESEPGSWTRFTITLPADDLTDELL